MSAVIDNAAQPDSYMARSHSRLSTLLIQQVCELVTSSGLTLGMQLRTVFSSRLLADLEASLRDLTGSRQTCESPDSSARQARARIAQIGAAARCILIRVQTPLKQTQSRMRRERIWCLGHRRLGAHLWAITATL